MFLLIYSWVQLIVAALLFLWCCCVPMRRVVGFCLVEFGLTVASCGLKLSVYGGRMVDTSRPVKPISFDDTPIGCNCSLCRGESIVLQSRPQSWTRPLSNDQLN